MVVSNDPQRDVFVQKAMVFSARDHGHVDTLRVIAHDHGVQSRLSFVLWLPGHRGASNANKFMPIVHGQRALLLFSAPFETFPMSERENLMPLYGGSGVGLSLRSAFIYFIGHR